MADGGVPIDERIADVSERLSAYFSELQNQADLETQNFIGFVFSHLVPTPVSPDEAQRAMLAEDIENTLGQIFDSFGIRGKNKIREYFRDLARIEALVVRRKKNRDPQVDPYDFVRLAALATIQPIVTEWQKVLQRKNKIYSQRDQFIEILKTFLKDKVVQISAMNSLELRPTYAPDRELHLTDLSSGEKQVVVMLGEALLQRASSHILIADEPELSLHIEWQERLVDALTELNPNAQLIFATHSPDIIGSRTKSTFDISEATPNGTK
jgi:hypothetical protein